MYAKVLTLTMLVAEGWFLSNASWGATPISGGQSGTFSLANSPYLATADIFVFGGQTLTIEAGVIVQFQDPGTGFFVDGALVARGTSASPILFTSDEAVKQSGQWKVLSIRSGATTNTVLENCIVECAASTAGGFPEALRIEGAPPVVISNCTVRTSAGNGLTIYGSDPRVLGCMFNNNTGFALTMRTDSLPVLRNNTAQGNANNAIGVFGFNVSRSGTWTKDNIPYTVYEDLFISSGATLTLESGVTIQFRDPDDGWFVDGTLIARGTPANPILFTSDEAVKQPGQWKVLSIRSGASTNTVLENCIVECGASTVGGFPEALRIESAPPVLLTNCKVRASAGNGLTIYGSDPRVVSCTFSNNTSFALTMRTDSLPVLRNNSAQGNGTNAIGVFGFNVGRSGTWTKDNIPYTVYEDVFINSGVTLTLEPGVTIQFRDPDDGWFVDGTLIARGTSTSPILFTSDEATKQPGQWKVLYLRSSATTNTVLENCIVECGASVVGGFPEAVRIEGAPPVLLTNCTIRASTGSGMTIYFSDPRVLGCTFSNNAGFALAMRTDSLPVLRNNSAQGNGKDAIGVFGFNVNRSGTWVKDRLPYTVIDDTYVNSGITLTLEPGLIVQFQDPDDALVVDGTLIANGTATNPILFTSDETSKQPGQWEQIVFRDSSDDANSILNNCIIEYGGAFAEGNLTFLAASPRVMNTTVRNSLNDGIYCNFASPQISNCRIINNRRDGIRTASGSLPIISNSTISLSAGLGVNNLDASKIIKAENNFWGHASGPFDNANTDVLGLLNPGGFGDKVSEFVDWSPFLSGDPTGGPQGPDIDVTPASLNFGNVIVGQSSNLTLIVSNVGITSLTVSSLAISNLVFSVVSPTTPFNVATGGQQIVTVRFAPTVTGLQTGALSLTSNDADEPT